MLVDYPILTLIVFLPALGALLSYVAGSARAARWIALGFSLLVLALASVLLAGFLSPDAITLPKMVTPGAHTYYAVEKSPWVPTLNVFYLYSSPHTFDMTVIISTLPIPPGPLADLAFVGLLIAFGTKLPTWPLHTWLPDAHVEAPTGGSVILAGVLLKLGGYGLIRFNVQMLPTAAGDLYWLLALVGIISILYGAFVCIAQDDLKRLVAFSSVSHMGFVTLGIAAGVYGFTSGGGYGRGAVLGFSA